MVTPASNTISRGAVFLSYAREDAEAARRIAEALRASGFEVWFDENELRGGDSWDVKIRKQIDACALFLPIISAHTQERSKGYFRLEWKLAVEQTHLLAEGVPFVAPVVIDDTKESGALVPPEFLRVQWTRLPGALPTPQFVEQVKRLLSKEQGARNQEMEAGRPRPAQRHEGVASPKKQSSAAPGWAWGVAAAALIAVGVGVATLRQPKPIASSSAPASATPANGTPSAPAVSAQSVAVLAFANLSDDKGSEYFSDGISEELLNVLAKVPGLKVSARTSAFYFKGKNVPVPEIAQQLGVAYVVEGSVRKAGDKVRITAQLIKAADGFHVWSDTFTRDLKDIFAVQDEIAGLIAKNLELKMGITSSESRREVNPQAHQLLLEGRHYLTLRTAAAFDQAERAFTEALRLDPQFAQAQAGLAICTALRGRYRILDGVGQVEEFDRLAIAQSRLALQMDPSLADPHAAIGFVFTDRRQLDEAEQEFQKAFAANPNYATAYHWHSHVLAVQGRLDLAIKEIGRATTLDPLSFIMTYIQGFYTCDTQQYAEALAILDRAASLRGGEAFLSLESDRARMLLALGRKAEALAVARKVLHDPRLITVGWYAAGEALQVLHLVGEITEATRLAESLIPAMPPGSYQRGYALCALGNFREGLPQLVNMPVIVQERVYWHPLFDPVRDTPEFQQLLVKLNCVEEYKVARATLARMLKEQGTKK